MYDNTTIESFGHWLCNIVLADKMLPTFFIMSGMLYFSSRKHKVEKKVLLILNKFDRLLVPYALFMTLYFAVIEPLTGPNSSPGHLWFLTILFSCFYYCNIFEKSRYKDSHCVLFSSDVFCK